MIQHVAKKAAAYAVGALVTVVRAYQAARDTLAPFRPGAV